MKNRNQDQFFNNLLWNDHVGEPNKAVEDRLNYSFLLKNSNSKIRQNSFVNFFGWIFSAQSMGLKAGLVSVVLFISVMNNPIDIESTRIPGSDSITNQRFLLADSTNFNQPIDSLRKDSLN